MYKKSILTGLIMIAFGSMSIISAQSDCYQKVEEITRAPFQVDTVRVIDPETYEATTKHVSVYLPGAPEKYEKVIEKDNMKIYYVKGDNCLMIRHIEEIVAKSEEKE